MHTFTYERWVRPNIRWPGRKKLLVSEFFGPYNPIDPRQADFLAFKTIIESLNQPLWAKKSLTRVKE